MPLTVPCPNCETKLVAPNSAVGQRLRCPKCGALATVPDLIPAEEVPVVEATIVSPRPKPVLAEEVEEDRSRKKPRRDEDDDDDDDERPRKKRRPRYADDDDGDYDRDRPRRRARRGAGGGLVAGAVIVGLLLLAGGGFAVYFFAGKGKGKGTPVVKRSPAPVGWSEYSYPQDGYKVYLPEPPNYTSVPPEVFRRGDDARGGFIGGRGLFGRGRTGVVDEFSDAERVSMIQAGGPGDEYRVQMIVFKFRDRVPLAIRERFRQFLGEGNVEGMPVRTVMWLGGESLEQSRGSETARATYTDRHVVFAVIAGRNDLRAKPEDEAGFFDNIELVD